jgi:hypothetical protein
MFSKITKHLTPSGAVAIIALVLAMTGGAYAVNTHGGGPVATAAKSKAKSKAKAGARGPAGPKGATGAQGPTGPVGPAGATGAKGETGATGATGAQGEAGKQGEPGKNGSNGSNGTSVTSKEVKVGEAACGGEGGSEFTAGSSTTTACNGKTGFTETLPSGKTETGTWSFGEVGDGVEYEEVPISFPIPLANGAQVTPIFLNKLSEMGTAECPGEEASKPKAAPGYLCVYKQGLSEAGVYTNPAHPEETPFVTPDGLGQGVSPFGTLLKIWANEKEGEAFHPHAEGHGTWAVTAP